MAKPDRPYPPEFRRRMIELVTGRACIGGLRLHRGLVQHASSPLGA